MRFALEELPQDALPKPPRVGDLYAAKGGNGTTALWLMVSESATGQSGHYLGLDDQGAIVSTASYNNHAMLSRAVVGRVDIAEIVIPVVAIE